MNEIWTAYGMVLNAHYFVNRISIYWVYRIGFPGSLRFGYYSYCVKKWLGDKLRSLCKTKYSTLKIAKQVVSNSDVSRLLPLFFFKALTLAMKYDRM